MKYSAVAVAAFVAFASAQDISSIPKCAIPCIDEAAAAIPCATTDYKCICENQDALVAGATTCVIEACTASVALGEVVPATDAFCAAVLAGGGDDTPAPAPSSAAPAPSSAAPAPSSAAPAPSSAAPAPSSAAPSGYPVAPSSAVSSFVSSVSSAAPAASSTTSSDKPVVTAGAAAVAGSFGLMVLGAVAAL
ncbi:hypothetical protein B0H66DRAFT_600355 [Apodospora peruviana]|uniref:CFEM domain-containing protein n=1 Tax=Apodospora peruviana TaxID=516989 RepID=A0AAE0IJM5_9PEZI|nr:hypothetical protein B0H66DRAFT_600355 [Apodospora peruviana]